MDAMVLPMVTVARSNRSQLSQNVFERREKKYLMTPVQYTCFMQQVHEQFVEDEYPRSLILSIYYDTPDHRMIRRSSEKPLYKEKIRVRSYGEAGADDPVFVELKKKYRGVVYKRRLRCSRRAAECFLAGMPYEQAVTSFPMNDMLDDRSNAETGTSRLQDEALSARSCQIAHEITETRMRYGLIIPSMMIITDRVALHTRDDAIRITFNLEPQWRTSDLTFEQSFEGTPLLPEGETIMEIKCLDAYPLWLVHALNVSRLYPTACSKYERAFTQSQKIEDGRTWRCANEGDNR